MTNLVGPVPPLKGDVITTTNNGQGFNSLLANVQDGNGNNSCMLLSTEQVQFTGGMFFNRTAIIQAQSPYSALATDYLIAITSNSAGVTVNLPAPTAQNVGQFFIVQDEVGNAEDKNITVQVTGGANIDGNPTSTLIANYEARSFYSNGTQYFRIT